MRSTTLAGSVLVVLGLACAEPTVPDRPPPSLSFGNGPSVPGSSGVLRLGDQLLVGLVYETNGGVRLVLHFLADDSFEVCGGSQAFPVVAEQFVTDPGLINGVIVALRLSGEVPVLIYPPNDGGKDLCDYLRNDWLFKGTGRLVYNDNNYSFDPSRANAFGWSGQGTVYDPSGNRYRYTEDQLIVVDPESFTEHVDRSRLGIVLVR
jgi:hypothetical protein